MKVKRVACATEYVEICLTSFVPLLLPALRVLFLLTHNWLIATVIHCCASSGLSQHMGRINSREPIFLLISHPDHFSSLCL